MLFPEHKLQQVMRGCAEILTTEAGHQSVRFHCNCKAEEAPFTLGSLGGFFLELGNCFLNGVPFPGASEEN